MDMIKIGKFITSRRKALGYTQDEFGEIIGVTGKAVSKWERGLSCPDVSLINRIAVELKVSVLELLNGESVYPGRNSFLPHVDSESFIDEYEGNDIVDLEDMDDMGIVSPYLFGNNLEHTRAVVNGGISAQILKNRKFIGWPSSMEGVAEGWYMIGERTYCSFTDPYTHHYDLHYHMDRKMKYNTQVVANYHAGTISGIGQHELHIASDEIYEFAIVAKCNKDIHLSVQLTDRSGKNVYAEASLLIKKSDEWERYTIELLSNHNDSDADIRLSFKEEGCMYIGAVSLMNKNNFRGMRCDVIEAMKEIGIKILRGPGGNFAGEYNWFDGLLPVDERAPLSSFAGLECPAYNLGCDFHEINTDDFIALCRELDAAPYITINLTWNTPEENAAWVEYCNGDITTEYGKLRALRGNPEPYNVLFWSLGNEFGYGHMEGDNTAAGYSRLAWENAVRMTQVCPNLTFSSAGPFPSKEWVEYSVKPLSGIVKLASLHDYSAMTPSWNEREDIRESYKKSVAHIRKVKKCIREMSALLAGSGVKISFDEWNTWCNWSHPSSVVDGIYTALMMHMVIMEAYISGIDISCQFEAVNESAIRVTPQDVSLTATGQALALMKVHAYGILHYESECVIATEKNDRLTVTMINPSYASDKTISLLTNKKPIFAQLYRGESILPHSHFLITDIDMDLLRSEKKISVPPYSMAIIQYEL